jgi:RNA polymerase sigma factor (sigma-70 family)
MNATGPSAHSESHSRRNAPNAAWEDARLVAACLDGDPDAWAALIAKYQRMIYSVPLRYGAPPQDAADIFQQVCVELFSRLADLRKVESLRSWLLTVASHQSLRWKQMRLRNDQPVDASDDDDKPPIEIPDVAPLASEQMVHLEREQALRESIDRLSARCSKLIRMLFYGDEPLPYAEVASRLGLATGSIGFIRGRCIDRLRKLLAEAGFR